jgi:hypothetical protein
MSKAKFEEMAKLQARLIKRSCTEYNLTTSMLLTEAARAIGELIACGSQQSDVEEVVRCKDCKYYRAYEPPIEDFDGWCSVNENEYDKEFYCQYGKKSEEMKE